MGIDLIGTITPKNGGSFATHDASYGKGGMRSVADITARDAIPVARRTVGMHVFVVETEQTYWLASNLSYWFLLDAAGGESTFGVVELLKAYAVPVQSILSARWVVKVIDVPVDPLTTPASYFGEWDVQATYHRALGAIVQSRVPTIIPNVNIGSIPGPSVVINGNTIELSVQGIDDIRLAWTAAEFILR